MNNFVVPESLDWLRRSAEGSFWLSRLPELVAAATERWSLEVGDPYPYAFSSLAVPVRLGDGRDAVLKVAFPHRESQHEADALRLWDGEGSVRLFGEAADLGALLLERCIPGTALSQIDADAALDVFIDLLPRLWKPAAGPFTLLADEASWWASYLEERWVQGERPFDRGLLDFALDALSELPATQAPPVLVNQDMHADNVLRAEREPWLVIDPKPLAGEREFGIAAVVRGGELGHRPDLVMRRLDRLCRELGLDRDRAKAWTIAQTVAWAFEGTRVLPGHIEVATWLHAGDRRTTTASPSDWRPSTEPAALVTGMCAFLEAVFAGRLRSLIVHGSVATGSYVAGISDIDLLAVVTEPLTDADRSAIVQNCRGLAADRRLPFDLRVVTAATAAHPPAVPDIELYVGYHPRHSPDPEITGPGPEEDLIIELDVCRDTGRVVVGQPTSEVLGPIPPARLIDVGAGYLRRWLAAPHDEESAEFIVLTACRIWRYAIEGTHASKADAAAWVLGTDPTLSAVRNALAHRTGARQRFDPDAVKAVITRALEAAGNYG